MSKRANPTTIGVFVLVAMALAVTGILTLGGLQLFREEMTWVAFFDGDVGGLAVGSPVLFRGAQVGQVSAIRIALDPHNRIAVYLRLDPRLGPKGMKIIRTQKELQPLIDRGMRAQLRIASLVTGQLSVSLDYRPEMPIALTGLEPELPEVPTVPTRLEQYQAQLNRILVSLEKVDLEQLTRDVSEMIRGIRDIARSPELASAVRTAADAFRSADVVLKRLDTQVAAVGERTGATLDDTRELVKRVDREIEPLAASLRTALDNTRELVKKTDREIEPLAASLRAALDATRATAESAQGALGMVNRALDGETRLGDDLSQALRQLAAAARSLNALADYLQRHPEALLRGKQGRDAQ
jgi:phospholipid/cholesterol/gamma-HCH transport system substrate-binding protein